MRSLPIAALFLVLAMRYLPSGLTESDIRLMNRDWKLIGGRKKR